MQFYVGNTRGQQYIGLGISRFGASVLAIAQSTVGYVVGARDNGLVGGASVICSCGARQGYRWCWREQAATRTTSHSEDHTQSGPTTNAAELYMRQRSCVLVIRHAPAL